MPQVSPGAGPHASRATCPECGAFIQWLSRFSPEEQSHRRELAKLEAWQRRPPSDRQLAYLAALHDPDPVPPANMLEASRRIEHLTHAKGVA